MSLTLPFPNSPKLPEKDRDSWLVAYAGWYQHFLDMTLEPESRLYIQWAHEMTKATLQASWMTLRPGCADSAYWARFDRVRSEFERQPGHWLAQANAIRERVLGDTPTAKSVVPDISETAPTRRPPDSPTRESPPMPAAVPGATQRPFTPPATDQKRRRTEVQLSFF